MGYGDYYWGLYSYRDSHRDPFPHSLLSTRQFRIMFSVLFIIELGISSFAEMSRDPSSQRDLTNQARGP